MDRGAVSLRRQEILRAVDRNLEGLAITLQPWFNDQMSYSFLGLAQCGGASMKPSQQVNRSRYDAGLQVWGDGGTPTLHLAMI